MLDDLCILVYYSILSSKVDVWKQCIYLYRELNVPKFLLLLKSFRSASNTAWLVLDENLLLTLLGWLIGCLFGHFVSWLVACFVVFLLSHLPTYLPTSFVSTLHTYWLTSAVFYYKQHTIHRHWKEKNTNLKKSMWKYVNT